MNVTSLSSSISSLKSVNLKQQISVKVVRKSLDIQKIQGNAAIKLIENAGNIQKMHSSKKIDLFA